MPDDLRTLAQAVVSAYETYDGERTASVGRDYAVIDDCRARYYDACKAVEVALGLQAQSVDHASARAILAALDAADAQGYARAMGEVDALAQERAARACPGSDEHHAMHTIAEWARCGAREQAAAAESG